MTLTEFIKKNRCQVSSRYQKVGHRYQRNVENKTYHIHLDIRTMKIFNPKSSEDCNYCLTFSDSSSKGAKTKAYNYLIENNHIFSLVA